MRERYPEVEPMGMFMLSMYGVPVAMSGMAYIPSRRRFYSRQKRQGRRRLRRRRGGQIEDSLAVGAVVAPKSPVIDQPAAALRGLNGLYLVSVQRGDMLLRAVTPEFLLEEGDVLHFTAWSSPSGRCASSTACSRSRTRWRRRSRRRRPARRATRSDCPSRTTARIVRVRLGLPGAFPKAADARSRTRAFKSTDTNFRAASASAVTTASTARERGAKPQKSRLQGRPPRVPDGPGRPGLLEPRRGVRGVRVYRARQRRRGRRIWRARG